MPEFSRPTFAVAIAATLMGLPAPRGDVPAPQSQVARVTVTPREVSFPVSRQEPLTPMAWDAAGGLVRGVTYAFTSSAPAVASVDNAGMVTAVGPGEATITVSAGGRSAQASIRVKPRSGGRVARVEVLPAASTIWKDSSVQLSGVAYDGQGRESTAEWHLWNTDNPLVAGVTSSGLVTGLAAGTARISMSSAGQSRTVTVTVRGDGPGGNVVTVDRGTTFQTMKGWQAASQNGWLECNPTAFARFKEQLADRLVNEMGIDRLHVPLRSGSEGVTDSYGEFVAGRLDRTAFTASWFISVNDNADPFVTDSSRFHWGFLDGHFDNAVVPLRQRLAARGERLYVVLTYIDFLKGQTKTFLHMKAPEEYAEFVVMAFKHLQQKYGFVPDALELVLEPEHTPYTATDVGRSMVAAVARLKAHGFTPEIIGPSTTSAWNAAAWYDVMSRVRGAGGLLGELAYHRYVARTYAAVEAIGLRGVRDGVQTSMLEHIGANFDDLYEDVVVGNVSSWMQYSSAFCGRRDNPDNQGVYYQVNQTDPANPKINITNRAKLFRQLFAYVRRGAVRVGATSDNPTDLLPLAFRNANGGYVAVVRARRGAAFTVRGLPAGSYGLNYGTPGARWNVNLPDQSIEDGGEVRTSIPGDGVLTIYAKAP